jgi:hypothetical protein
MLPAEFENVPIAELLPTLRRATLLEDEDAPESESALVRLLAARIRHLLTFQTEHLMQILYRLDVPEQYYTDSLKLPSMDDTVRTLAEGILARERIKAATRRKYREWQDEHKPPPSEGLVEV